MDTELPDDASFEYAGVLDHAPATSHGTYPDGINEGLEPLEEYREGGYHPIHLGDTIGVAGRYRVLCKLGHGGFGTVWLCRDTRDTTGYVAVKVMVADIAPEAVPDLTLVRFDRSAPGAEHIAIPLDAFSIEGPNGVHQCLVLPVLGPYDFRTSNILVKLASLNKLSEDELLSLLGQPKEVHVRTESGGDLSTSSPRYLTPAADLSRLGDAYLTDQICVIDFGESYAIASPPADMGMPENYLPPEVLLDEESAVGPACDLWALGCPLFEIRQQIPLFYMIYGNDTDELLSEMARADFFDDRAAWLREDDTEAWSLEVALSKSIEIVEPGSGEQDDVARTSLITSEAEQKRIADLLYKLFRYDPEKRLSAEDVVAHEWFTM
ncbi:serine/threonine protein kinase [Sporothrix schenckii ATCC 58251]|uniref:non-specific serine/threonine protein kinase n=1 Tax=Sporothrix schenckii (strain ATCC 58251 / de Perez 2211183) TaxID=1391915 RepID=U7PNW5_SPOS1|nr:serine/threonine protein kinase [Sporothrix schenckii ATCC 58251]